MVLKMLGSDDTKEESTKKMTDTWKARKMKKSMSFNVEHGVSLIEDVEEVADAAEADKAAAPYGSPQHFHVPLFCLFILHVVFFR
jgi:hypothetical protein